MTSSDRSVVTSDQNAGPARPVTLPPTNKSTGIDQGCSPTKDSWNQSTSRLPGVFLWSTEASSQRRYSFDSRTEPQGDRNIFRVSPFGPVGSPPQMAQIQTVYPPSYSMYPGHPGHYDRHSSGPVPGPYGPYSQNYAPHASLDKDHYDISAESGRYEPMLYDSPDSTIGYDDRVNPKPRVQNKGTTSRRSSNKDEFDGQVEYLPQPSSERLADQARSLPIIPTTLPVEEQDHVLSQVNDCLSQCAFDFVAKYQFPIPVEADKRSVRVAADREWTEWVYLLKRLATKRRIPARVLYQGQIKQFVTVLENSMEMRHAAKHQSRPPKDDRNVLQLISAGIQVAKLLQDAVAMRQLDYLYERTECSIDQYKKYSRPPMRGNPY